MRIWFNIGTEDRLAALEKEESFPGFNEVETCRISGKKYVDTHMDFLNHTTEVPDRLLIDLIDRVTIKDHCIYRGFRTDGVYYYEDAELVAETEDKVRTGDDGSGGIKIEREVRQHISIAAPNVEALQAIYSQFRQGLLKPTENWENEFEEEVTKVVKEDTGEPAKKYGFDH